MQCSSALIFKFKNVQCKSFNESLMVMPICQIRAVARDKNVFNMWAIWRYSVNEVSTEVQIFKRANGFKPWLFKYTINFCEYLKKRNHRLFGILFNLFKEYTKFGNHNMSFRGKGNVTLLGLNLNFDRLKLPLPTGVYMVATSWILDNKLTSNVNVTVEFVEDFGLDAEKSLIGH